MSGFSGSPPSGIPVGAGFPTSLPPGFPSSLPPGFPTSILASLASDLPTASVPTSVPSGSISGPPTTIPTGDPSPFPSGGPPQPTGFMGGPPAAFGDPSSLHGLQLDRGPLIIGITSGLLALTLLALGLRLMSRYMGRMKLLWDDWLAITAAILLCAKAGIVIVAASPIIGGGRHMFGVSFQQTQTFLELMSFIFLLYPLIIGFAKCSILCFYIRLFGIHRPFRCFCYAILACIVVWSVAVFLPTLFMCGLPLSNAWTFMGRDVTCINKADFFLASTALDAAFDVIILVAPLRPIWKLKLSTKKKLAITGALLLGASEFAFTIARLIVFTKMELVDMPWDFFNLLVWTMTQESVGVLCVCLPVLGPLFQRQRWRRGASAGSSSNPNSKYSSTAYKISTPTSTDGKFGSSDGTEKTRSTPRRSLDGGWSYQEEREGIRKTVDVQVRRLGGDI